MADQVNVLSIRAALASDDYVRGAQQIQSANKAMSQTAAEAGTNVVQFESKVSSAADGFTKLVNRIDPAAKAARQFQQDMLTLGKAIDSGKTSGDAAVNLYVALSAKLGLVASETQIASQNLAGLAQVVAAGNERMRQQAATIDVLAASYREMAAAAREAQAQENANAAFNRSFGVAQPVGYSASASASVFEDQLRQQDEAQRQAQQIAQLRAQQAGANFASDLNARLGVNGSGTDARASASVFEEQARAADALEAKIANLRAQIDPVGTSWAAMNRQIAEYEALMKSGAISVEEFAQAETLARSRHEQLKSSLSGGTGPANDNLAAFRRQDLGFQANDIIQGLISGQPIGQVFAQQSGQIVGAYQQAGGFAAVKTDALAAKEAVLGVASAIGPVGIAFGIVGTAALAFYALTRTQTKTTDEVLKQHAENIKALGDAYGIATDKAKTYSDTDKAIAEANVNRTSVDLAAKQKDAVEALTKQFSVAYSGRTPGFGLRIDLGAFAQPFNELRSGTITADDFVKKIREIGNEKGMQKQADQIISATEKLHLLNEEATKTVDLQKQIFNDRGPGGFLLSQGPTNQSDSDALFKFQQQQEILQQRTEQQFQAQIAGIIARSPTQKADAARQQAAAQYNNDESAEARAQRIELAGTQALIAAEHDLRLAREERERQSQAALAQAQYEASIIGQSVEQQNRLKAAYQAEAQIREAAARAGVAADETEIANAKAKAAAIVDYNAQIQAGKLLQDQRFQIEQLQLQADLIGKNADEAARLTAALQAKQQIEQAGIPINSQLAQQYIANAQAMAQAQQEIQRQQAAYQSLQQAEGNMIDTFTAGITGLGGTWKDTLRNMASQFLQWIDQLAIANPLKNALTGTNLPTLTDLFSGKPTVPGAGVTSTAAMTVNAATVMINGSPIGSPLTNLPSAAPGTLGSFLGLPAAANGVRPTLTNNGIVNSPLAAANTNLAAAATPSNLALYQQAISKIESGSFAGNYNAIGPTLDNGNYAIGRYQVMASNVPSWSQKWYGQQLTPQQFQANPQAQDAVFNGEFGSYVNQYGPSGAASKWFTGSPYTAGKTDALGTTDNSYVSQFNANLKQLSSTTSNTTSNLSSLGNTVPNVTQSFTGLTNSLGSIGGSAASGSASGGGFFGALFHLFGFADGTASAPGGLSLVGERGPELINLPRGSKVYTNQQTRQMLAGGGGGQTNVSVGVTVDNDGNLKAYVKSVAHSTASAVSADHVAAGLDTYRREGLYQDIETYQKDPYSRGAA